MRALRTESSRTSAFYLSQALQGGHDVDNGQVQQPHEASRLLLQVRQLLVAEVRTYSYFPTATTCTTTSTSVVRKLHV